MGNTNSATSLATETTSLLKYKGIYYFKLNPEYFLHREPGEDEQKTCGLLGSEIDSNFHFLSGFDAKNMEVADGKLIIHRINEEFDLTDPLEIDLSELSGNPTLEYDDKAGELKIFYPDGTSGVTGGFITDANFNVSTNGTLVGTGSKTNPLALSSVERTGSYAPVLRIEDRRELGTSGLTGACGDRIVTREIVNEAGLLYPYSSVENIQRALEEENHGWRVPTREDWDELLNALEDEEYSKNHNVNTGNPWKGEWAGTALKSSEHWENAAEDGLNFGGFNILPVGFVNDSGENIGSGKRSILWTYGVKEDGDVDVKEFNNRKSTVANDDFHASSSTKCSIRLVKDYVPGCVNEYEDILGLSIPTGLISRCDYSKVWTLANLYGEDASLAGEMPTLDGVGNKEAYFINEFDGEGMPNRKRMNEGDKVVVLENDYHEYMLKDGELIDVFDETSHAIEDASNALSGKLAVLSSSTESFSANVVSALTEMAASTGEALAEVEAELRAVDDEIKESISALTEDVAAGFAEAETMMREAVNEEKERAEEKEAALEDEISALSGSLATTDERIDGIVERIAAHEEEYNVFAADTRAALENAANTISALSAGTEEVIGDVRDEVSELSGNTEAAVSELSGNTEALVEETRDEILDTINEFSAGTIGSLLKSGEYELTQEGATVPTVDEEEAVKLKVADDFFSFGTILPEDNNQDNDLNH